MRKNHLTPSRGLPALLRDDHGFVLSAELVLILTLGVLAMVVGVHAVAKSINAELTDVAQSFSNLNQSYWVHGFSYYCPRVGLNAATGGSGFFDGSDVCDCSALSFSGGGLGVAGRSTVVGHGAVVSGSPVVTEGPAVAGPTTPCPPGTVEAIVPCPGDCPCEAGDCPPGATLEPTPLAAPNAVEPKPETGSDKK